MAVVTGSGQFTGGPIAASVVSVPGAMIGAALIILLSEGGSVARALMRPVFGIVALSWAIANALFARRAGCADAH
ncbi:hypothetical protein OCH239_10980 [Roseivivax halodurans JCM 10272]|uniref:Uncharacterized protein n=1 Tax=Roseivivax halodurans JCM 10272 TaxID=1449350 RepID=X7EBA3_9RHOB|nr:hypothetical protein [Roseivivax halodurans]ETX13359.1 hypothetical protein OCH239_10980 [Roseivivax halodurans JCM 10272]